VRLTNTDYRKYIRDKRYRRINKYKLSKGCKDCGYAEHPKALCFDHVVREDKTELLDASKSGANMSTLVCRITTTDKVKNRQYIRELFDEIRKCEVRCQNCHSIKTWEERDYMPHVRKNKDIVKEKSCYLEKQREFNF
tara:strand:- start:3 stop:416 length:414 start_codon:yes stop_codon:yes gene_type:complete